MKTKNIKKLIKYIVAETLNHIREEHENGEFWIDSTGNILGADRDTGDYGHDSYVIQQLALEILEHFGISVDDPGNLNDYEEAIKEALIKDGRFSEDDAKSWNNESGAKLRGSSEVILAKLIEDNAYKTPKQASEAVTFAYGSSMGHKMDSRDYAMMYWKWKRMVSKGKDIIIETWHLTPEDLSIIVRGIWEIMFPEDPDNVNDPDNTVGEDNYTGPRIELTVSSKGQTYHDVPLAVLEKKVPSSLRNYFKGKVWMKEELNEDFHLNHKEYRLYEGSNHIVAIFEDNSRLMFEVHYHDKHGEDKDKWRRKAFSTWKSIANEIYGDEQLSEVGNPIIKSWKECFQLALKSPKLQEYIRQPHQQKIFVDPVNFSYIS